MTLAGAIASDIHGKNHHRDGGLARHVAAISLCTPAGGLTEVSPETDPDLFYATLGGMGLTGVVVEATLRAEPLRSPWVAADVDRTDGLEQTLELMSGAERHRYSVAWLDLLADGSKMGRAIVSRADPLASDAATPAGRGRRAASGAYPGSLSRRPAFEVPRGFPAAADAPGEHAHVQCASLARHTTSRARAPAGDGAVLLSPRRARGVEPAIWPSLA